MQAMDAATNNAKQMVKNLTVKYNKARQEAITTELIGDYQRRRVDEVIMEERMIGKIAR